MSKRDKVKAEIQELFNLAENDQKNANKYVTLALKMRDKNRVRLTTEQRRKVCKHCKTFLIPGKNLQVRTVDKKLVYFCKECKKYMRFPI